jgi:predicted TPR repeat methyltransferase
MSPDDDYDRATAEATAEAYDAEAQATGWLGPEVAFGLVYEHVLPGQSVLDLGIGTGLASVLFRKAGLRVHGMDISQEMLDAYRAKGFDDLARHDLAKPPYPYASESFDHVVCVGVLNFLNDPSPVFAETGRLLKAGGTFVFVTLDRTEGEDPGLVVGPEHTKTDESITMYRHSGMQISGWVDGSGCAHVRSLPFTAYMDADKTQSMRLKCYVAKKTGNLDHGGS